ncbi:MAG TPA: DUF1801 domain-containing protein [Thermomicrobiales bacterium]|nr:DUF1801 domain-containing protein [Thermomicrobiales bacterium]
MTEPTISADILAYNAKQDPPFRDICDQLSALILAALPEATNKIWHAHPVWFLAGNPIVGYSKLKGPVRLLYWSGQTFDEPGLTHEGSFKAAEKRYFTVADIDPADLNRWLAKSRTIQWDYKNIVKRKGHLERIPVPNVGVIGE